jgi:predicted nuclease with TOPRIM domain
MSEELRSQAEILAAIVGAREDLTAGLADLQATVDELTSRPLLTDEEKQALEEQAESGELGEDMRTLVGKIKDGEDTWEQVFSGESPHGSLLQGHLTRMFEEHKEDIALAFEELIEAEEAKGNFIFDEVPTSDA